MFVVSNYVMRCFFHNFITYLNSTMMKNHIAFAILIAVTHIACKQNPAEDQSGILMPLPDSAQAVSLLGDTLYSSSPYENVWAKYDTARSNYEASPNDADKIIWYGRWAGYKGDFRQAITIFSEGIERFPQDARMLRHRGHRYISIREFDRAIADLEKAAKLIEGKADEVEPDGQPNALNIPVSSLHSNIWYHLGLAYYLKNDLAKALPVYERAVRESENDDKLVSTTHWLYMVYRMTGNDSAAKRILSPIQKEMRIIENNAYQRLCLLYKGELPVDSVMIVNGSITGNDAIAYGVANWYRYNGNEAKAKEWYERILQGKIWASFGYIAAEADYVRYFKK